MKTIIIYSGKGGVGKSTTTANLARSLSKKHKVFVFDADVNTPSMNKIFEKPKMNKKLLIKSLGYEGENLIYIHRAILRKYISEAINDINNFKPDYVLIDTPPSLGLLSINSLVLIIILQDTKCYKATPDIPDCFEHLFTGVKKVAI